MEKADRIAKKYQLIEDMIFGGLEMSNPSNQLMG